MNPIEKLRNKIKDEQSMNDVVKAIIFKSEVDTIPKAHAFLQQSFFELKKKEPDLLHDFIFDESGIVPYSDELDEVLFRIESASILPTLNPSYENYTISNDNKVLETSYLKFTCAKKTSVDHCAEVFAALVTKVNS